MTARARSVRRWRSPASPASARARSAIFIDTDDLAAAKAAFIDLWFDGNAPAGLQIGSYSGSGVGLSTGGDAVNLYNGSGVLQASVSFGASPSGPDFATFANDAGLDDVAVAGLSVAGVNGALVAAQDAHETGSPGVYTGIIHAGGPGDDTYHVDVPGDRVVELVGEGTGYGLHHDQLQPRGGTGDREPPGRRNGGPDPDGQ